MLRAVPDTRGYTGKSVTLSNGDSEIGRNDVTAPEDVKLKVSRAQLRVTFSFEDKRCSVTRIGGSLSLLTRAESREAEKIKRTVVHIVLPP